MRGRLSHRPPQYQATLMCRNAYTTSCTSFLKGVRSLPGTLRALRSNSLTREGNCLEAASPVPSMPGRYTMSGRSAGLMPGSLVGMYGLMKRGGPPANKVH